MSDDSILPSSPLSLQLTAAASPRRRREEQRREEERREEQRRRDSGGLDEESDDDNLSSASSTFTGEGAFRWGAFARPSAEEEEIPTPSSDGEASFAGEAESALSALFDSLTAERRQLLTHSGLRGASSAPRGAEGDGCGGGSGGAALGAEFGGEFDRGTVAADLTPLWASASETAAPIPDVVEAEAEAGEGAAGERSLEWRSDYDACLASAEAGEQDAAAEALRAAAAAALARRVAARRIVAAARSSSVLQRFHARRQDAATALQAAVRGIAGRRRAAELLARRREEEGAALELARAAAQRLTAALSLQRGWRRVLSARRCAQAASMRLRERAAVALQAAWRGWALRRRLAAIRMAIAHLQADPLAAGTAQLPQSGLPPPLDESCFVALLAKDDADQPLPPPPSPPLSPPPLPLPSRPPSAIAPRPPMPPPPPSAEERHSAALVQTKAAWGLTDDAAAEAFLRSSRRTRALLSRHEHGLRMADPLARAQHVLGRALSPERLQPAALPPAGAAGGRTSPIKAKAAQRPLLRQKVYDFEAPAKGRDR